MDKKWKKYLGMIVLIGGLILIYKDIFDLWNTRDLHTVRIDYAIEVLEVSHRIDVIIPAGKNHYFLALKEDENGVEGYIIRASEKWHDTNFDSRNLAVSEDGVEVTALSKETENKYQSIIGSKAKKVEEILGISIRYPQGTDHYLDTGYRWKAILKLVTLIMIILEIVAGVIFAKHSVKSSPVLTGYLITVILTVFMFLACIFISL